MPLRKGVNEDYFEWLYSYVCKGRAHSKVSYKKVFEHLNQTPFIYSIPNDVNRARDGVDLRYRYAMTMGDEKIVSYLDGPCSVLEMMVALAIRCEETIMDDTRYGDRTGQWFWDMMRTLGIGNMTDDIYDEEVVEEIMYIFLHREYSPDGRGGLFYIKDSEEDLRDLEIWIQLCWYLDKYE
jgi:hypothetical protein